MKHVDPFSVLRRRRVRHLAGAVRRLIVHHEHADAVVLQQGLDERRNVLAFVVSGNDHERVRHERPSKRSDEICSEMSPTRRTTTLNRMSSTEELVTWDCVTIVHSA